MQITLRIAKVFLAILLWASLISAATPIAKAPAPVQQARFSGMASWYGSQHQGRTMANGQPFDRFRLTAAAWSLPLGTKIHVVNMENGKSVVVTITDRGPHRRLRRALDLSEAAAERLGYVHDGLAQVSYRPVTGASQRRGTYQTLARSSGAD
jgi:rare lipoprotein A